MTEQEVLDFVRNSIGSIWALELLVLLGAEPGRAWRVEEAVRESRSSPAAVNGALRLLASAGLVAETADGIYQYRPASPNLDAIGELVQKVYATKPTKVIAAIYESPSDRLRIFAQAFLFKE